MLQFHPENGLSVFRGLLHHGASLFRSLDGMWRQNIEDSIRDEPFRPEAAESDAALLAQGQVGAVASVHEARRAPGIGHTQPPSASGAAWKAGQKSAAAATGFDPARATVSIPGQLRLIAFILFLRSTMSDGQWVLEPNQT